jgi:hypothetical protein
MLHIVPAAREVAVVEVEQSRLTVIFPLASKLWS